MSDIDGVDMGRDLERASYWVSDIRELEEAIERLTKERDEAQQVFVQVKEMLDKELATLDEIRGWITYDRAYEGVSAEDVLSEIATVLRSNGWSLARMRRSDDE